MQQIDLKNWTEFKPVIDDIRNKYGYHEYTIGSDQKIRHKNTVLFRGQQRAEWPLKTTLERKTTKTCTVSHYISQSTRLVHELESFTGSRWEIDDFPNLAQEIQTRRDSLFGPYLPREDYLIYLRHHGYPSPLLDWSESPFIAAYFALSDAILFDARDQKVAIYAYIDSIDSGKSFEGGLPLIKVIGPFVSTHKRHFTQKAQYTIAAKWSEKLDDFVFCSHHDIFDNRNKFPNQDILMKITLPSSESVLALRDLDDYNINHFTLFQNEDALIKKLSIEDFDLKDF
jgi:hypothetical protein